MDLERAVDSARQLIGIGLPHEQVDRLPQRERHRVPQRRTKNRDRRNDHDDRNGGNIGQRHQYRHQNGHQHRQERQDDVRCRCTQLEGIITAPVWVVAGTAPILASKPASEVRLAIATPRASTSQPPEQQRPKPWERIKGLRDSVAIGVMGGRVWGVHTRRLVVSLWHTGERATQPVRNPAPRRGHFVVHRGWVMVAATHRVHPQRIHRHRRCHP